MRQAPVNRSPFGPRFLTQRPFFFCNFTPNKPFLHPMTPCTSIPFSHPTESVEIEKKKFQMKFAFLIKKSPVEVSLEMKKKCVKPALIVCNLTPNDLLPKYTFSFKPVTDNPLYSLSR